MANDHDLELWKPHWKLCVQLITYLVTANCPPKVAQTLARHSTISLTMDRYTHLGTADLVAGAEAVAGDGGEWGGGKGVISHGCEWSHL